MIEPDIPVDEASRLEDLAQTGLLKSGADDRFDRIARLGAAHFGVPIALLSLLDHDRQWFKACVGLCGLEHTPREVSFCAHAVAADAPLVVEEARSDPRFSANPLVLGPPGIRFYAGVPVHGPAGRPIGTFCVIDTKPRSFSATELDMLRDFAALAEREVLVTAPAGTFGSMMGGYSALDSVRLLAGAVEHCRNGVIIADANEPDHPIIYVNPSFQAMTGYDPPEVLGRNCRLLQSNDREQPDLPLVRKALATGRGCSATLRNYRRDGSLFWNELTISPVRERGGQVSHFVGILTDVTERKMVLEMTRNIVRSTAPLTGVEFVAVLLKQLASELAAKFVILAQTSHDSPLRVRVHSIWGPDGFGASFEHEIEGTCLERVMWGESVGGPVETPWPSVFEEGVISALYMAAAPLLSGPAVSGYLAVLSDNAAVRLPGTSDLLHLFAARAMAELERERVEEALKAARDAAQAATDAKSRFLATMSHEIRTPINAVIGMTSVLLEGELSPDQREAAEIVRTSGESLLSLLTDVLDFSKIESDKLTLEAVPFDLTQLIQESLDMVSATAFQKGLDLAWTMDPALPSELIGDVSRLRQILVNLLSNAVKFTERGSVAVRASGRPNFGAPFFVRVDVGDTGIGIPPERLDRLFRPFSQVDASTTRKYGGSGLGLAISKRLAEIMGGCMEVQSVPGQGSTFSFTFEAAHAGESLSGQKPPRALQGRPVLIQSRHPITQDLLVNMARVWGMQPLTDPHAAGAAALWIYDAGVPPRPPPPVPLPRGVPAVILAPPKAFGAGDIPVTDRPVLRVSKPVDLPKLKEALARLLGKTLTRRLPSLATNPDAAWMPAKDETPLRILLVEDHAVNQKVAQRLLGQLGHRADVASSGVEALRQLHSKNYDIILMDVQMPEMDGLEATRRIRSDASIHPQPMIVAMTANVLKGDRETCLDAGMDDYIGKPIRPGDLRTTLDRVRKRMGSTRAPTERHPNPGMSPRPGGAGGLSALPRPEQPALSHAHAAVTGLHRMAAEDLVDFRQLEDVVDETDDESLDLFRDFLRSAREMARDLEASGAPPDQLAKDIHKLKGLVLTFGCSALASRLAAAEAQAKAGTMPDLKTPSLSDDLAAALAAILERHPGWDG